jgi:hypothetical protein
MLAWYAKGSRESVALAFLQEGQASAVPESIPEKHNPAIVRAASHKRRDMSNSHVMRPG